MRLEKLVDHRFVVLKGDSLGKRLANGSEEDLCRLHCDDPLEDVDAPAPSLYWVEFPFSVGQCSARTPVVALHSVAGERQLSSLWNGGASSASLLFVSFAGEAAPVPQEKNAVAAEFKDLVSSQNLLDVLGADAVCDGSWSSLRISVTSSSSSERLSPSTLDFVDCVVDCSTAETREAYKRCVVAAAGQVASAMESFALDRNQKLQYVIITLEDSRTGAHISIAYYRFQGVLRSGTQTPSVLRRHEHASFCRGIAHLSLLHRSFLGLTILSAEEDTTAIGALIVAVEFLVAPAAVDCLVSVLSPMKAVSHSQLALVAGMSQRFREYADDTLESWNKLAQRVAIDNDLNDSCLWSNDALTKWKTAAGELLSSFREILEEAPEGLALDEDSNNDESFLSPVPRAPNTSGALEVSSIMTQPGSISVASRDDSIFHLLQTPVPQSRLAARVVRADSVVLPETSFASRSPNDLADSIVLPSPPGATVIASDSIILTPQSANFQNHGTFIFNDSFSTASPSSPPVLPRNRSVAVPSSDVSPIPDEFRCQVATLHATIRVLESEKRSREERYTASLAKLSAELDAERATVKDLQLQLKKALHASHAMLLQIPRSGADPLDDASVSSTSGERSGVLGGESPLTPFNGSRSAASPRELRAARRNRQLQNNSDGSPRFVTPRNASLYGAASSWASDFSHASVAAQDDLAPSFVGLSPLLADTMRSRASGGLSGTSRMHHAQALRRMMILLEEQQEFAACVSAWARDGILLEHTSSRKTLKRFRDTVDRTVKENWSQMMKCVEERDAICLDAVESARSAISATLSTHHQAPQSPRPAVPNGGAHTMPPEIALDFSTLSDAPHPSATRCDIADAAPTPGDVFRRHRSCSRTHRLQSTTPGGPSTTHRPGETMHSLIMSGRNLRGEQRKMNGEKVPHLKCDQIRAEAVSWKQGNLDEYKAFAAHQVIFFGDANVGKSSVIACLTQKAPKLFRKAPTVLTPTLDLQRTLVNIPLGKPHGCSALVPVGGSSGLTMVDAQRIARESAGAKDLPSNTSSVSSSNTSASGQTVNTFLTLAEIPTPLLRASAPHSLPRKGALYCIVFRLSDSEESSRQSILVHVQHVLAVAGIDIDTVENGFLSQTMASTPTTLPFVLVGTHADHVAELRDETDFTAVQRVLGTYREWLEEEFQSIRGMTAVGLNPVVLDAFAVSCASWTVSGERPKSADSFAALLTDWASYLMLHSPNAPEHFLPTTQRLLQVLRECDDFEGVDQQTDSDDPLVSKRPESAPVTVDNFWMRRGGGLQGGGLFADQTRQRAMTTTSGLTPTSSLAPSFRGSSFEAAPSVVARWLHSAANGVITLFTALKRFTEFTGYIVAAKMFDNIVLQHLQLAARADEERHLSTTLLRVRDVLVEELLLECRRRCLLTRLSVEHRNTEVVALGTAWQDTLLSSLMMPLTVQMASTLITSPPQVRQQCANVGCRNIVVLLQRIQSLGLDLTAGALPLELSSYRSSQVSRKLLFQLLPAPLNSLAASQRVAETVFSAVGLTHIAVMPLALDDTSSPQGAVLMLSPSLSENRDNSSTLPSMIMLSPSGAIRSEDMEASFTSNATAESGDGGSSGCVWLSALSTALFLPSVASTVPETFIHFLELVMGLVSIEDSVLNAIVQVDMPFMSLFPRVQSRLFLEGAVNCATIPPQSGGTAPVPVVADQFVGMGARNCFVCTLSETVWLLVVGVGGDCNATFSEYRVVMVRHSGGVISPDADGEDPLDASAVSAREAAMEEKLSGVVDAFRHEIREFTGPVTQMCCATLSEGPSRTKRSVESWCDTEAKLRSLARDTAPRCTSGSAPNPICSTTALRDMIERTAKPSLKTILNLATSLMLV